MEAFGDSMGYGSLGILHWMMLKIPFLVKGHGRITCFFEMCDDAINFGSSRNAPC